MKVPIIVHCLAATRTPIYASHPQHSRIDFLGWVFDRDGHKLEPGLPRSAVLCPEQSRVGSKSRNFALLQKFILVESRSRKHTHGIALKFCVY